MKNQGARQQSENVLIEAEARFFDCSGAFKGALSAVYLVVRMYQIAAD